MAYANADRAENIRFLLHLSEDNPVGEGGAKFLKLLTFIPIKYKSDILFTCDREHKYYSIFSKKFALVNKMPAIHISSEDQNFVSH